MILGKIWYENHLGCELHGTVYIQANERTGISGPSGLAMRMYIKIVLTTEGFWLSVLVTREVLLWRCVIPINSVVVHGYNEPGETQTW